MDSPGVVRYFSGMEAKIFSSEAAAAHLCFSHAVAEQHGHASKLLKRVSQKVDKAIMESYTDHLFVAFKLLKRLQPGVRSSCITPEDDYETLVLPLLVDAGFIDLYQQDGVSFHTLTWKGLQYCAFHDLLNADNLLQSRDIVHNPFIRQLFMFF